jgi:3-hydroxybutyryl-CoA dehydratase
MRRADEFAVGESVSLEIECDRYRPIYYAAASGDFNPIHIDPEVGNAAGLGGVILQGLCTMAWAAEAAVRLYGEPTRLERLKVRFARPVKPGDRLEFRAKVTAVNGAWVSAEITALNQRGEEVLKSGVAEGRID